MRLFAINLVPPVTWALHLQVSYMMHMSACEAQNRVMLVIVSIVALVIVAVDALFAWRTPDDSPLGRFMTETALAGSFLFALVIIGQTIPMLMLRPCD